MRHFSFKDIREQAALRATLTNSLAADEVVSVRLSAPKGQPSLFPELRQLAKDVGFQLVPVRFPARNYLLFPPDEAEGSMVARHVGPPRRPPLKAAAEQPRSSHRAGTD